MSVANLGSTLVGIPLAIVLEIVVATNTPLYHESWDPKDTRFREWMLPAGGVLLLIPFFLMSWWIEAPIAAWILSDVPAQFVDSAVRDANLVTYGLLATLLSTVLVMAIRKPSHASASRAVQTRPASKASAIGTEKAFESVDPWRFAPWRFANERARMGIARLKVKEDEIVSHKPVQTGADIRGEPALDREKAA
jgi:Flp pilus assembly pilin Flp